MHLAVEPAFGKQGYEAIDGRHNPVNGVGGDGYRCNDQQTLQKILKQPAPPESVCLLVAIHAAKVGKPTLAAGGSPRRYKPAAALCLTATFCLNIAVRPQAPVLHATYPKTFLSIPFISPFDQKIILETLATQKVSLVLQPIMETKERILQKAHELFHRYGIRSVSMDEIATQMGMSKKTLYQHFVDKDQLVDEVFVVMLHAKKSECVALQQHSDNAVHEEFLGFDNMSEMLSNMHPSLLYDLEKYHPAVFTKFRSFMGDFVYKLVRTNLERGINEGLYRSDIDVDLLARFRVATITLTSNPSNFPNKRHTLAYIEEQLLDLFLHGVVTAKGQKLIQKYKDQRLKTESK